MIVERSMWDVRLEQRRRELQWIATCHVDDRLPKHWRWSDEEWAEPSPYRFGRVLRGRWVLNPSQGVRVRVYRSEDPDDAISPGYLRDQLQAVVHLEYLARHDVERYTAHQAGLRASIERLEALRDRDSTEADERTRVERLLGDVDLAGLEDL